jgi:3-deoxy-manno-octulosonate cytidylyltransferase (CMP-KDO synthetase)
MKKVIIIPARYSSSRLPGKPLQDIEGRPMVVRVCEVAIKAGFDDVVVATDDQRIFDVVDSAGYQCVMTSLDHVSGTDRLQEAANKLNLNPEDIVVNLQGDEPLMPSSNLAQVASLLVEHPSASVATLFVNENIKSICNPNVVKLVTDKKGRVLYFSRSQVPYDRDGVQSHESTFKRHVGIYAYRKSALDNFISYGESTLENLEKLEQLRFMDNGDNIVAASALENIPVGVDTFEDLESVRALFRVHKS